MEVIKVEGSDETMVRVSRVPCVGEVLVTRNLSRRVVAVAHLTFPVATTVPGAYAPYVAVVTVVDE